MRLDGAAKFLVFPLNICGRWNLTEFTAFRRPEKLPKENMIRGVKSILQNNLVNLDDHRPHWVINCGTSVHVVPDALFYKWINGELPLDVEIARRILEEWRDERITDEGQGRHK